MTVSESIESLRALHGIDAGIRALETELDALPKALDAAREDQRAIEAKLTEGQAALDAVLKKRRELEQQITDADQMVIKYENDKIKVKTNEEFRALNSQIDTLREKKSALEDQVLLSMDEEEAARTRVAKLKDEVAMITERTAARSKEIEIRAEQDRTQLAALQTQREAATAGLEGAVLTRYEALRGRKGGTGVALVLRNACSGCHTAQPPQKMNEVRKQDQLHHCDFCGRFLLWNAEEATAS